MWFPAVSGTIDRRILINYAVDPDIVARYLPSPFRPKLFAERAIVGICLIRLKHVRPKGLPRSLGISSENGAHRIAVEWTEQGIQKEGVFVPRRDTSSRINALAGGRVFPGIHHHAHFNVEEGAGRYAVEFRSSDDTCLMINANETDSWNGTSIFPDLGTASEFMRKGSFGYSPTHEGGVWHGLELRTQRWEVLPLHVSEVRSSFFMDRSIFPEGSIRFDGALLMKNIEHEWHGTKAMHA